MMFVNIVFICEISD